MLFFIKIFFIFTCLIFSSNIDNNTYAIRSKREEESKINFIKNIVNKINNPSEFIKWFYTEHKAYSSIVKYVNNNKWSILNYNLTFF